MSSSPSHQNIVGDIIDNNDLPNDIVKFAIFGAMAFLVLTLVAAAIKACWDNLFSRSENNQVVPEGGGADIQRNNIYICKSREETLVIAEDQISDKECAICLETLSRAQPGGQKVGVLGVCEHVFHFPCIVRWIMSNNSCPVCRQVVDRLVVRSVIRGEERTCTDNRLETIA